MDKLVTALRAAGEPTRLRLLVLLSHSELAVTELVTILRQSQPRVSRHLKLLAEAGLIDRFREGSWVFYRLSGDGAGADFARQLMGLVPADDVTFVKDLERLAQVRLARSERAATYFRENAPEWDQIRELHLPEEVVEAALLDMAGPGPIGSMLDLGTGTGRIVEIFGDRVEQAVGIDQSPEMLAFARSKLESESYGHCQVRHGDLFDLPFGVDNFDVITVHQVLHFLDDPAFAVREAARVLKPGGRLLIADFAPHSLDFLREEHAHRRLGFSSDELTGLCQQGGLDVSEIRRFPPEEKSAEKLTVLCCLAIKPDAVEKKNQSGHAVPALEKAE
ncbi:MAG: metalloregulator ArsR/SmtB family transcription factor [Parvibaculaceae bacterium]|nr:metalloregulator ArsR/SmtB family transcription factor [Parvibaculaceae bacterium]